MRKIISGLFVIFFILCVILLSSGIHHRIQKNKQIAAKILSLPSFSFTTLSNDSFSSSDIKEGPLLIVYYQPDCEHCQYEISGILRSHIPDSGIKVILISAADPDSIRKFISQFNYSLYTGIILLEDTSSMFGEIFGSETVPSNYLYNRELELVKVLHGEVKTETILKYLLENE